ncbi:MAG: DUF4974 domain-containing protein [Cytophagales bacterium]|nr:DUF4974 domain-containing protein [Cytophagales bacterium]
MEELICKYFAGEARDEEKLEINRWRSESLENAHAFIEMKTTWLATEQPGASNDAILSEILDNKETKIVLWPSYLKYAAAIILIGLLGSLWYFNESDPVVENTVFTGEIKTLPDGTVVTLKEGATLDAIDFSSDERRVSLTGKAFFDVVRDESRPFFVVTDDATVRVLGTSFLVDKNAGYTEVCVETGLVVFSTNDPAKNSMSVNLEPGEMGVIGNHLQGIVKRKNDNQNFLAWKDGALTFERAKSTEVIRILEDVYGAQLDLPENLNNCRLTAKFKQKSLEEVIQIISITFDWTYEIDKDKVVLSGEGC